VTPVTSQIEPYREAVAPPSDRCFPLVLKPIGWKARMWRAFDNSVTLMLRLDTPFDPNDIVGKPGYDLLLPFRPALRSLVVYLERGASVALPLPWSVGRATFQRDRSFIFLHRVLDDPFGVAIATMFRAAETQADLTLALSLYEADPGALVFAVRDYDIGVGSEFLRS
jgi:hypothetical protein